MYGSLPAPALVEETHCEELWISAYVPGQDNPIAHDRLEKFFKKKFAGGHVLPPSVTFDPSSFTVDGIPVSGFESLLALAQALEFARSN